MLRKTMIILTTVLVVLGSMSHSTTAFDRGGSHGGGGHGGGGHGGGGHASGGSHAGGASHHGRVGGGSHMRGGCESRIGRSHETRHHSNTREFNGHRRYESCYQLRNDPARKFYWCS
jgi:hypothetical protein